MEYHLECCCYWSRRPLSLGTTCRCWFRDDSFIQAFIAGVVICGDRASVFVCVAFFTPSIFRQMPPPSSSLPLAFRLDIVVLQVHGGIASDPSVSRKSRGDQGVWSLRPEWGAGGDQGVRNVSESLDFCRCNCTKIYRVRLLQHPALFLPKVWLWRSGVCLGILSLCASPMLCRIDGGVYLFTLSKTAFVRFAFACRKREAIKTAGSCRNGTSWGCVSWCWRLHPCFRP